MGDGATTSTAKTTKQPPECTILIPASERPNTTAPPELMHYTKSWPRNSQVASQPETCLGDTLRVHASGSRSSPPHYLHFIQPVSRTCDESKVVAESVCSIPR